MPYPEVEKDHKPIYGRNENPDDIQFATVFSSLGGKFIYCDNEQELIDNIYSLSKSYNWKKVLCTNERVLKLFQNNNIDLLKPADPKIEDAEACITDCEMIVARTGSFIFSSKLNFGRTSSVYYPFHFVVVYANQVVTEIDEAFVALKKKYGIEMPSMVSLTTGPSRTADIEKTLVVGVHGPTEIFCLFVNAEI